MAKYDLIISGGTILDPANGVETISDLGIRDGVVKWIAPDMDLAEGHDVIDASRKWVMPGHIDTHAHVASPDNYWDPALGHTMLAQGGATTFIDFAGTGRALIDGTMRKGAGLNVASLYPMIPGSTIPDETLSKSALTDIVTCALREGCIGIKILGGYYPFTAEITSDIISVCNDNRAYIAYHVGTKHSGSRLDGLREVPDLVGRGRLHVAHINAYCRGSIASPNEECEESLSILDCMRSQLNSEVHHAIPNATNGRCDQDDNVIDDVPRNCLRLRDYPQTRDGMRKAILDEYGHVMSQKGREIVYIKGRDALDLFDKADSDVAMSFPVNLPTSSFRLTTAKNDLNEFIVDAVASDGGTYPRNIAVQSTMALVQFGALTPLEMATKLSWMPARMFGLLNKGHFSEGADADITIMDPSINKPVMSLVAGRLIMQDGMAIGSGGTLLVTNEGIATAKTSGLPYQVVDLSRSKLYEGYK